MKLVSWNVNGLRAVDRKDNLKDAFALKPDILCIQETKARKEQLTEELQNPSGYTGYFFSPTEKKGYSGVAVYSKVAPEKVEYGMGIKKLDTEGRQITAHFKDFVLVNCYFPNGGQGPERLAYKFEYYDAFLSYVDELRKKQKNVIFCGDVNTAHEEIDLARPKENQENTGFLPEERAWIDEVILHGYIDTYRHFNPEKTSAYSYWDMKTRARDRNVGWRIDYIFASRELQGKMKKVDIHANIQGSDHCPTSLELL